MTDRVRRLLLLSGSLDPADATTVALAATTTMAGPFGEIRWSSLGALPVFDADRSPDRAVYELWSELDWADAVLVGAPLQHGLLAPRAANLVCWSAAAAGGTPRPTGLVADATLLYDDAFRASLLRAGFAVAEPSLTAPDPAAVADGLLVDAVARRSLGRLLEALAARSPRP
jgi:NAD(P)H-dependent FMN reductase